MKKSTHAQISHQSNSFLSMLKTQWLHHSQAARFAATDLVRTPFANLITILVIAITLSISAILISTVSITQKLTVHWPKINIITLVLKTEVNPESAFNWSKEIAKDPTIKTVNYISREAALKEFQQQENMKEILAELPENPFPALIEITAQSVNPAESSNNQQWHELIQKLQSSPLVSSVEVNTTWISRFQAGMNLLKTASTIIILLLSFAVLLIIGNTIRLNIQHHWREIKIIRLMGASSSYLRRPFLYSGFLYGLSAGIVAVIICIAVYASIFVPLQQLLHAYGNTQSLSFFTFSQGTALVGLSMLLGLIAARLTVAYSGE